jgi:hypothetical protein
MHAGRRLERGDGAFVNAIASIGLATQPIFGNRNEPGLISSEITLEARHYVKAANWYSRNITVNSNRPLAEVFVCDLSGIGIEPTILSSAGLWFEP